MRAPSMKCRENMDRMHRHLAVEDFASSSREWIGLVAQLFVSMQTEGALLVLPSSWCWVLVGVGVGCWDLMRGPDFPETNSKVNIINTSLFYL